MRTSTSSAVWEGGLRDGRGHFERRLRRRQRRLLVRHPVRERQRHQPRRADRRRPRVLPQHGALGRPRGREDARHPHQHQGVVHDRQGGRRLQDHQDAARGARARCPASTRPGSARPRRRRRTAARSRRRSRATCSSSWTRGWHRSSLPYAGRRRDGAERSRAAHRARHRHAAHRRQPARRRRPRLPRRSRRRSRRSAEAGPTGFSALVVLPFVLTAAVLLLDRLVRRAAPRGAARRACARPGAAARAPLHPQPSHPRHAQHLRRPLAHAVPGRVVSTATRCSSWIRGSGWCSASASWRAGGRALRAATIRARPARRGSRWRRAPAT